MSRFLFDNAKPRKSSDGGGFTLRDYQAEDCDEACRQWAVGNLHQLCVHATGLGKSLMAAELASRKPEGTRALIIVDSTDLSKDLYRTVTKHTGRKPGIVTGDFKENWHADILIATKQCLCAGGRYKRLAMHDVSRIIVDECEAALANEYIAMMVHFLEQKPNVELIGLTATPLPANNRKITDLFGYCADKPGPLYRDLQWAYLNGWLVKPMQGYLRCSLDFASLKVRKQDGGESDYSDKDIAKLMLDQDERQWLELAGGIYQISKNRTSIVVCPNSTEVADKLAGYIEGQAREDGKRGFAYAIHRRLGKKRSGDMMNRFKAGEFPCAVSVRMFEKGFDYDGVDMVVMVRRTKSLRLYTQVAGRGTRPLADIRQQLSDEPDPKGRMRIIAESYKPACVIVDCVGINDQAKDILGIIDILGRGVSEDIRERVRQMGLDKAQAESEKNLGREEEEDEPPALDVGDMARQAQKDIRDEKERERRARLTARVDAHFELENGRKTGPVATPLALPKGDATDKMVRLLIAFGVSPNKAQSFGKRQAGIVIQQYKKREAVPDWSRVNRWERSRRELA